MSWRDQIFVWDEATFRAIHLGWHSRGADLFFEFFSWLGLGHVQGILCLGFLFSSRTRRYVAPIITTILVSGLLIAQVAKQLIERDRPSLLNYAVPQEPWKFDSFPSGHTSTSFAVATMLWLMTYRDNRLKFLGPLTIVLALLVGISRIYRGVHWPTDVIGGVFAGVLSSLVVNWMFAHFANRSKASASSAQNTQTRVETGSPSV
jgi:undecaprenyl-diphosphatase